VLVLSRKSQESVIVGDFDRLVKVTVLTIGGDTVTRRFEGDAEVPIHRFGAWERIRSSGQPESPAAEPAAPLA
jgi:carbon storage regulator CsrA